MEKLVLIDGNSLLNRAFYATPVFTTKAGFPTNAIFGFIKLLFKIATDKKPEYLAVAFDLHAPTFRHELYKDYKAGRKPMPEELAAQLPVLKEVLRLMNIRICEKQGFEADDIIGTLAKRFPVQTYIYTGDRDAYQLVDETTTVCFTKRGVSDLLELNSDNFKDETGLEPRQIIDLKALMGDSSDNIPGVAGIGEKTAKTLIDKYDTLDGIYARVDEITGATGRKLQEGKQAAYFSYKLATIDTNAPIDVQLSECIFQKKFSSAVRRKFVELEFKSLTAMSVFEEDEGQMPENLPVETERQLVKIISSASVDEIAAAIENSTASELACYYDETQLCIYLPDKDGGVEYDLAIKKDLLDVGFFPGEADSLLLKIAQSGKKLLTYQYKQLCHYFHRANAAVNPNFEDVALMKYLADGTGVSESLDFCLDFHNLPREQKGHGIYKLIQIYAQKLDEKEKQLYENLEKPLTIVLLDMEIQGVQVDEKTLERLSKQYQAEIVALTDEIQALAGETFNVNSPLQLGKILFEKLKIGGGNAKMNKGKKGYVTTAEVLEGYKDEHPIVPLILRYRQIQKLSSTYLEGFKPLIKDGRVHTTFNQTITTTGRLSSANPNLQNIPVRNDEGKELRKLFKASDGNVLIDADYSQIELRLLAHFSGCKELKDAYNAHKDIHTITASQVFDVAEEDVTSSMRREAKAVNFGIIYGISAFGLSKDLSIPAKKAKEYIERYFASYSSVKTYIDGNVETAQRNGYVKTLLGRKRVINEINSSNAVMRAFGARAAMNMPLQGTSADIIKMAMISVFKRLKEEGLKAKLILQVHDELVIDCPIAEKEKVSEILKYEMENVVKLDVPLTVEVGEGTNWFDAH